MTLQQSNTRMTRYMAEQTLHEALRHGNYHQHVCIVCRNARVLAGSERRPKLKLAMIVSEFWLRYAYIYIILFIANFS